MSEPATQVAPPSTEPPSALPSAWVDRLFDRFAAMYGKAWWDCWLEVPMADVKDCWRSGLARFSGADLKRGLERCAVECRFPPTLPEFAALCLPPAVPAKPSIYLSAPRYPMPDDVRAKLRAFVEGHKA